MIKGKRDGLQVLKDGSVKLTVSISKEDLSEAVNMHDLFISADMPKQEIDAEEVKKKCMEALDKAMEYIRGERPAAVDLTGGLFDDKGRDDVRNSG